MYKFIVYKATNLLNEKVYIGLTSFSLNKRKREHYQKNRTKSHHFANALRRYSRDVFTWEEIAYCKTREDAIFVEIFNIALYNSMNRKFGYNSTLGGDGIAGRVPWNKGKPMLPHVRAALAANKGKGFTGGKHTEETRKVMSQKIRNYVQKLGHGVMKGFKHTPETRLKMSIAKKGTVPINKGQKMSQEYNEWLKSKIITNKKVIAINLNSGLPLFFNSILDASKFLKISRHCIGNCLSDNKPRRGFDFSLDLGV